MKNAWACALPLVLACGGSSSYLPDGGRELHGCENELTVIPVRTVDLNGTAIPNATVTATNQSTGKVLMGTTNGGGETAAITEDIGEGQIAITATQGTRATQMAFVVQVTCSSCDCTVMPSSATVTLR